MRTRQLRLHDRRVLEREAQREATRAGQGEDERRVLRSRRALAWRLSQQRCDRVLVELVGTKLLRLGIGAAAAVCGDADHTARVALWFALTAAGTSAPIASASSTPSIQLCRALERRPVGSADRFPLFMPSPLL